tara:strand:+ start:228 stop:491 length:264 start_codon:yes stop_codon:yes gene_type:complete
MAKSFFGTDGIRGTVNTESLNSEIALKLGLAAGKIFTQGDHKHRVLIGKDTRISGYMLESALESQASHRQEWMFFLLAQYQHQLLHI